MTDFVLVQMNVAVAANVRSEHKDFCASFLHFALAENKLTDIDCFAHNLRGMGLGNSNQLNVGHLSYGDLRRLCDLILPAVKVCFDIDHGYQSEHFGLANPA